MSDLLKDVLDNCMKKLHSSETDQVGNTDFTASNVENACTPVQSKTVQTDKNVVNSDVQQLESVDNIATVKSTDDVDVSKNTVTVTCDTEQKNPSKFINMFTPIVNLVVQPQKFSIIRNCWI